ncbi:hypothetical protein JD844_019393 [Phrynosoma platyrhinos]|uniref:Uncharacterized protein n=1 Tax=Phrynosoma platyrhinos TaxID=52577 RepID=A0ABQ7SPW3_PHRPL|nr:hypothetical protein JD844_019393 [Phrynosoma platyrhinos]
MLGILKPIQDHIRAVLVDKQGKPTLLRGLEVIKVPRFVDGGKILGSLFNIVGINILNVQLPHLSVKLIPKMGVQLSLSSQFRLRVNLQYRPICIFDKCLDLDTGSHIGPSNIEHNLWILQKGNVKYSKADELRNATLALIPGGGSAIISTSIVYLKISLLEDPKIVFKTTGAIVFASVRIEAFVKNADGSVLSVVVVTSSLKLAAAISVVSSKLKIALSISENVLVLVSSGVGITDVS